MEYGNDKTITNIMGEQYDIQGVSECYDDHNRLLLRCEIRIITPEMAKELLSHNISNRNLKKGAVYANHAAMEADKWYINGQSIVVNERGELKDGQHKLTALIKANKCYPLVYVTVRDDEAKMIDIGVSRSIKDQIMLSNDTELEEINDLKITGAASFLLSGSLGMIKRVPKFMLIEEIKKNIDIWLWLKENEDFPSLKCKKSIGSSPVFAAVAAAYKSGYPENKLNRFMNVLNTGVIANANETPIVKLRDYLMSHKLTGGRDMQKEVYLRCQHTLKAYEEDNIRAVCRKASMEYYKW